MIRRKFFSPFNRYRFKLKNVRRRFNERRESIKFNQVKKRIFHIRLQKRLTRPIISDRYMYMYINLEFFRNYSLWQRKSSFHRHRVIDVLAWGELEQWWTFSTRVLSSILYLIARFTLSLDSSCVKRERCFAAKKEGLSTDIHLNLW